VAPSSEVGCVDVVVAVRAWVIADFLVVHVVGDHDGNLVGQEAGADVLPVVAISLSAASLRLVLVDKSRSNGNAYRECPYTQVAPS
jgi:hypothetical protein